MVERLKKHQMEAARQPDLFKPDETDGEIEFEDP
jgi:hypothetical protein